MNIDQLSGSENEKVESRKSRNLIKGGSIHISLWIVIAIANYFLISSYPFNPNPNFHLFSWILYLAIFYINFNLLMPFLFFKKKYVLYIIVVLSMLGGIYLIKDQVRSNNYPPHQERIQQRVNRQELRNPRGHNGESADYKPNALDFPTHGKLPNPNIRQVIFSVMNLLFIFTLSFAIKLYTQMREDENKIQDAEKEKILAELSLLKHQVNPHFLFNSLNNIYSLANSKSEETTTAILKLSEILRYMIYDSEKSLTLLSRELECIENYIELQKIRLNDKTNIISSINYDFVGRLKIEPLLLMPIIENAFKFGSDNITQSFIKVDIKVDENFLLFHCENKTVNREVPLDNNFGIGLKNVKRRLDLLYVRDYDLKIYDDNDIFKFLLKINLNQIN